MNELQAAWDAYQQSSTSETLTSFLVAAGRYQGGGGVLSPDMARLYKLAGAGQPLPPVVVKGKPANWLWLAAAAVAAWLLFRRTDGET